MESVSLQVHRLACPGKRRKRIEAGTSEARQNHFAKLRGYSIMTNSGNHCPQSQSMWVFTLERPPTGQTAFSTQGATHKQTRIKPGTLQPKALLAGAKAAKVLCGLGHDVREKLTSAALVF